MGNFSKASVFFPLSVMSSMFVVFSMVPSVWFVSRIR